MICPAIRCAQLTWLGTVMLALCAAGCNSRLATYPVEGRVTLADGSPLSGCRVVFDQSNVCATAITDSDGRYRLGTFDVADGAPAGTYRILVAEPLPASLDDATHARFDARYSHFESSGLEFSVREGRNNCDLILE